VQHWSAVIFDRAALSPLLVRRRSRKAELDAVCSKTQDSPALTKLEIKSLIERCDRLKPRIEKLDESAAKVYLKRLKMCRDLFAFMLESSHP